jgi:hypothetical protein
MIFAISIRIPLHYTGVVIVLYIFRQLKIWNIALPMISNEIQPHNESNAATRAQRYLLADDRNPYKATNWLSKARLHHLRVRLRFAI